MSNIPQGKRDSFGSSFGVFAAAVGSAVGLGNIWRFPYITGQNGGAAFLLVYLAIVLLIGIPLMLSELSIGRHAQKNPIGAFLQIAPGKPWFLIGIVGVAAAFMISSFYSTVAGWTLHYTYLSVLDKINTSNASELETLFNEFHTSQFMPLFWQFVFMLFTGLIVIAGVRDGIEKYTKILMPLLFIILIILSIRSVTLEGAKGGLEFLFYPDFSKIHSKTVLDALGQAFFSLSIGMGTLITYGSYIQKNANLSRISLQVALADSFAAILAGIAIFPAVFAFGIAPSSGPGLVFLTLPGIFEQMTGGYFFSILFFVLLVIAALTSSVSILEVVVAYLTEELKIKRKQATILATAGILVIGSLATLSFSTLKDAHIFSKTIFDFLDYVSANLMLPLGGFFIVIFVGWAYGKKFFSAEITNDGNLVVRLFPVFNLVIKYIAPIAIALVFLNELGILG